MNDSEDRNPPSRLEGFAAKVFHYSEDLTEAECVRLGVDWPRDIHDTLTSKTRLRGRALAELEKILDERRPHRWLINIRDKARDRAIQILVGALLVMAATVIRSFLSLPALEISYWTYNHTPVAVPSELASFPLALAYDGNIVRNAVMIEAALAASGGDNLGGDSGPVDVRVRTEEGASIAGVLEVLREPESLEFGIDTTTIGSNDLRITFDLLEPKDLIRLRFIVLNGSHPDSLDLHVETDRGSGIKVVEGEPSGRLYLGLWRAFFVFAVVGIGMLYARTASAEMKRIEATGLRKAGQITGLTLQWVWGVAVASIVVSATVAGLAAFIIYRFVY